LDRLSLIAAVRMLDVGQCQAHHCTVIHVRIKLIIEFEIPTAGLAFPVLHFPIAHGADLLLQDPVCALDDPGITCRHSAFAEADERVSRIPDGWLTWLHAKGFAFLNTKLLELVNSTDDSQTFR